MAAIVTKPIMSRRAIYNLTDNDRKEILKYAIFEWEILSKMLDWREDVAKTYPAGEIEDFKKDLIEDFIAGIKSEYPSATSADWQYMGDRLQELIPAGTPARRQAYDISIGDYVNKYDQRTGEIDDSHLGIAYELHDEEAAASVDWIKPSGKSPERVPYKNIVPSIHTIMNTTMYAASEKPEQIVVSPENADDYSGNREVTIGPAQVFTKGYPTSTPQGDVFGENGIYSMSAWLTNAARRTPAEGLQAKFFKLSDDLEKMVERMSITAEESQFLEQQGLDEVWATYFAQIHQLADLLTELSDMVIGGQRTVTVVK